MKINKNQNQQGIRPVEIKTNKRSYNKTPFIFYNKLVVIIIIVVISAIYLPVINYQFTYHDDVTLIDDNYNYLSKTSNFTDIFNKSVFFNPQFNIYDKYYRPILTLSFFVDTQIAGKNHIFFYLTNILLHIACTILLFYFLRKIEFGNYRSFLFSLVFAAHPALVQTIAWVPGRNDSLLFLFALLSIYFFADYFLNKKNLSLIFHFIFFFMGILTKETAVLLPLLYLLFYLLYTNASNKKNNILKIFELKFFIAIWLIISIVFFMIRKHIIGDTIGLPLSYMLKNMFLNTPAILQYIGKMLLPLHLNPYPLIEDTPFIYGIISLGIVIFLLIKSKNVNYRRLFFGICWLLIFLIPAIIRTSDIIESSFLEHRMYFPIIGFFIILSETDLIKKLDFKNKATLIATILFIAIYIGLCINHRNDYKDEYHYWKSAVECSPHGSFAHQGLGTYYVTNRQTDKAIAEFTTAIKLNSVIPNAHNNLGRIYFNNNNDSLAEKFFIRELEINPNSPMAHYNLGLIRYDEKNYIEAEKLIRKSLKLNLDNISAMNDLSVILAQQKKYEESINWCIFILDKDPKYELAYNNIKLILEIWDDKEKVSYYKKLLNNRILPSGRSL